MTNAFALAPLPYMSSGWMVTGPVATLFPALAPACRSRATRRPPWTRSCKRSCAAVAVREVHVRHGVDRYERHCVDRYE